MSLALSLINFVIFLFFVAVSIELFMIICWFAIMIFFTFKDGWKDIKEIVHERKHRT